MKSKTNFYCSTSAATGRSLRRLVATLKSRICSRLRHKVSKNYAASREMPPNARFEETSCEYGRMVGAVSRQPSVDTLAGKREGDRCALQRALRIRLTRACLLPCSLSSPTALDRLHAVHNNERSSLAQADHRRCDRQRTAKLLRIICA